MTRAVLVHLAAGIGNLVLATPLLVALDRLGYAVDLLLHADYPQAAELFGGWSVVRRVHAGRVPAGERWERVLPAVPPFYWARLRHHHAGRRDCVARPPDALFARDEQGWYLAFAEALGWPRGERPAYTLPVSPDGEHGVTHSTLVLAPGCKTGEMAAKRWPHFPALAERFADVAVVGTEDDLRGFDGAPLAFPAHARSLAGRLTLRETASVLAAAGAVVANDSGPGHLAGAAGAPTLLLFGPTSEHVLGAFPPNVAVLRAGLPCEPCWTTARLRACAGRADCLRALDVGRVAREVHLLLGTSADGGRVVNRASLDETPPVPLDGAGAQRGGRLRAIRDTADAIPAPAAEGGAPRPHLPLPVVSISRAVPPAAACADGRESNGGGDEDGDPSIPLVSCLMPTRDRRRFVAHALEQFLRQDHPRRELVVVDDGADPVDDLLPADPRIRYHRVARQRTLGAKRNLACSLARGELLAHWDDDDWMPAHRISAQVAALAAAPRAGACGLARLRFFDPAAGRAWEYRWPDRSRPWLAGGTLLFRRALWEKRPFPGLDQGEDTRWVWSLPAGAVAAIADPGLYAALVHPGNTSRKRTGDDRWHPIPLDVVRAEIGEDWSFYAGLAAPAHAHARAG
ncbi:MAG TPA: glycosyltransferase family 9 protein [Longimicrobium sp.]|nr:glycosyltransferase family 9 protein [Longimicrobium sp.]